MSSHGGINIPFCYRLSLFFLHMMPPYRWRRIFWNWILVSINFSLFWSRLKTHKFDCVKLLFIRPKNPKCKNFMQEYLKRQNLNTNNEVIYSDKKIYFTNLNPFAKFDDLFWVINSLSPDHDFALWCIFFTIFHNPGKSDAIKIVRGFLMGFEMCYRIHQKP
jgi:hypothetical protein